MTESSYNMINRQPHKISRPPDYSERQRVLEELDRTILVEAAAGTGKTSSMIGRMIALVREGKCPLDTMAAITFTRKAAAELRSRFQVELELAAGHTGGEKGKRLAAAVNRIERCFIGTIHSFCGRILRERPIEAGVDMTFREMEEDEDYRLREQGWDEYVTGLYAGDSEILTELDELGLEVDQLRASFVTFADYPDVHCWPVETIQLDGLNEGRDELNEYVRHMGDLVPSFPDDPGNDSLMPAYGRIVRMARNRNLHRIVDLMAVLEEFKPGIRIVQRNWPGGKEQAKREQACWNEFTAGIAEPLVRLWREKRYRTVMRIFREAVVSYDRLRAGSGGLSFQDLLMGASRLLRDKPQIRRYFRARFTHILVDEFQDTDPIQAEVMMYLTSSDPEETDWRKCTPVPGSLFVVGDPKQSIYRFRRADIVTYNQVKDIIRRSGGRVVTLTTNFRTVGDLVEWGNRVFSGAFPSEATQYSPASSVMQTGREGGTGSDLAGVRVIAIPPEIKKKEDVIEYDADFIARYIRHALDAGMTVPRSRKEVDRGFDPHVTPGDFLIITRTKAQLAFYAHSLQRLGIPHQVSGGSALRQVSELKLLIDCLRAVTEPENPVLLVAVLRGDLFGLSDRELYEYKRAGGKFSYRSELPGGIDGESLGLFRQAYTRLRRYSQWLNLMPAVSAIERIADDLGLPVRALTHAGGDVQAGSIVKMFGMLRAASSHFHSVVDLTQYMADLIEENAEFDGIPVRANRSAVVRLMNLHRVKGLEAPIVFLANPTGKWDPPVDLHIDRSGHMIKGYMAVYGESTGYTKHLLALPSGWEKYEEEEKLFDDAEQKRLLYVAATRAGTQLVISNRASRQNQSYWDFFPPWLADAGILPDPGPQEAPAGPQIKITGEDIERATHDIAEAWKPLTAPSYLQAAAKEISVGSSGYHRITTGEHGTEWGTVIHLLLETAMKDPKADLEQLARAAVSEEGLESLYVPRALQTVELVMKSKIWKRAISSEKTLVEVPFTICRPAGEVGRAGAPVRLIETDREPPVTRRDDDNRELPAFPGDDGDHSIPIIIRGVIDLVFEEPDGWVIVDYKSDAVAVDALPGLVDHYRQQVLTYRDVWEEITGEPVKEAGLFYTHVEEYVIVT